MYYLINLTCMNYCIYPGLETTILTFLRFPSSLETEQEPSQTSVMQTEGTLTS